MRIQEAGHKMVRATYRDAKNEVTKDETKDERRNRHTGFHRCLPCRFHKRPHTLRGVPGRVRVNGLEVVGTEHQNDGHSVCR